MREGRVYLFGAGTVSTVRYGVRQPMVWEGGLRWVLPRGAFSGLYAPGPGVEKVPAAIIRYNKGKELSNAVHSR